MMPAELVFRTVAMAPDSRPELPHFGDELGPRHGFQVLVHDWCSSVPGMECSDCTTRAREPLPNAGSTLSSGDGHLRAQRPDRARKEWIAFVFHGRLASLRR